MTRPTRRRPRLIPTLVVALSVMCRPELSFALGSPTDLSAVEPTPDDISQAAQYFDKGRNAFRAESYIEAAEAFEKADALAPNAKVLLLAIQSREMGGHLARAATLAALAQQRHPNDPLFTDITDLLKTANESLNRVTVKCSDPCQVMVGNRLIHGPTATRRYLYLEEGKFRIRASWSNGHSLSKYYEAKPGKREELSFTSAASNDADDDDWGDASGSESDAQQPSTESKKKRSRERSATSSSDDGGTSSDDDWGSDDGWGQGEGDAEPINDPPDDPLAASGAHDRDTGTGSGLAPWVFWTSASATGILVGVSIWSGIDTLNNPGKAAVVRDCVGLGETCPTYKVGLRNQERTNILWGVTAGVGLISALVGTLWTDWGDDAESADSSQISGSFTIHPIVSLSDMTTDAPASGIANIGTPFVGATGRF